MPIELRPARTLSISVLTCALTLACAPSEPAPEAADAPAPEATATGPVALESGALRLVPMTDSPRFDGSSLALTNVEAGASLPVGAVAFDFEVTGYELGVQTTDAATKGIANSADGQHIHLILNNEPYSAHYEADFEKELEEGHYVALAFLSRSYHESLKNPGAALLTHFAVGEAEHPELDTAAPHLFYSRPKGTYVGTDIERLMLDFYLLNTDLAPGGNAVHATIDGESFHLEHWVPYLIEGLEPGEVEISLQLVDAGGSPIPGPFNSVTRTVTLEAAEESAAEE